MKMLLAIPNGKNSSYVTYLTRNGHLIEHYNTGRECLRAIKKHAECERSSPFNLLIVNHQMPDMDGLNLCRQVRIVYPDQRIILISNNIHESTYRIIREFTIPVEVLQEPLSDHRLGESVDDNGLYEELKKFKNELTRIGKSAEIR
jgi:CheY-like chemotaxis protein